MNIYFYKVRHISLYFYIIYDEDFLYRSGFCGEEERYFNFFYDTGLNLYSLGKVIRDEVEQYFTGKLKCFSVIKNIYCDNSQKIDWKVYRYLAENVKFGDVISYKELGRIFNIHPRKVGWITRSNKIPLIIPCHRVIMSDGSLGGYMGENAYIKRFLLSLEGSIEKDRLEEALLG